MINRAKKRERGNNCWIGANATVLKGSMIQDNRIVRTSAVISKIFSEKNIVIAGNPGKVVKRDIAWLRDQII